MVPWWTKECHVVVRNRHKAFKQLKRTHTIHNLIKYKKAQAMVRKTVRQAKRAS